MGCLRNIGIDTLHKGDDDDGDDYNWQTVLSTLLTGLIKQIWKFRNKSTAEMYVMIFNIHIVLGILDRNTYLC